jgi:hypothetical protein
MTTFESFGQEGMETPSETGLGAIELVNYTEVGKFEASGLLSNQEVGNYLRETLPPSHLENCPSIEYKSECSKEYPDAIGTCNRLNNEICIWGPVERFEGAGEMLETVTHEVGHSVHNDIMAQKPEVAERWNQLHEQSWTQFNQNGTGFVSDYAQTNMREDFAETYKTYVCDPEKLSFYSPEKYEFMRSEVFSGTTYSSPLQFGHFDLSEVSN